MTVAIPTPRTAHDNLASAVEILARYGHPERLIAAHHSDRYGLCCGHIATPTRWPCDTWHMAHAAAAVQSGRAAKAAAQDLALAKVIRITAGRAT